LLFSESLGHRIRVLAEHPGDRRGTSPMPLSHGSDGASVSDSVSAPCCSHRVLDQPQAGCSRLSLGRNLQFPLLPGKSSPGCWRPVVTRGR
jgi:hypothetical protein